MRRKGPLVSRRYGGGRAFAASYTLGRVGRKGKAAMQLDLQIQKARASLVKKGSHLYVCI